MIKNSFISVIPQEENKGSVEFQDCVVALKNQHSQNSVLHTHSNGSQKTQKTGNTAHNLLGKSQTYSSTQRTRVTPKTRDKRSRFFPLARGIIHSLQKFGSSNCLP